MKSTHKAKDLNGNWVEGTLSYQDGKTYINLNSRLYSAVQINPSTLSERVRGTGKWDEEKKEWIEPPFFEGDEVNARVNSFHFIGHIKYSEFSHRWMIQESSEASQRYWIGVLNESGKKGAAGRVENIHYTLIPKPIYTVSDAKKLIDGIT